MPSTDVKPLVNLGNGSTMVSSPRGDQYWILKDNGEATRISLQQACQIWIHRDQSKDSHTTPEFKPPRQVQTEREDESELTLTAPNLEAWQRQLLEKLNLADASMLPLEDLPAIDEPSHA